MSFYMRCNQKVCPHCGGTKITCEEFNSNGMQAWHDVECLECGTIWREFFSFSSWEVL